MGSCVSNNKKDQDVNVNAEIDRLLDATYDNTPEPTYEFKKAKVIKVYDGDTLTIAAFHDNRIVRFNVRLYGIDCDEMKGGTETTRENARLAKRFVEYRVLNKIVDIDVLNNKMYNGKKLREKFGRLLALITVNGKNLSNELLINKLARKYDGGHKDNTPLHPVLDFINLEDVNNAKHHVDIHEDFTVY